MREQKTFLEILNFSKGHSPITLGFQLKYFLYKLMEINLFENIFYIKYLLIGIVREEEFFHQFNCKK